MLEIKNLIWKLEIILKIENLIKNGYLIGKLETYLNILNLINLLKICKFD